MIGYTALPEGGMSEITLEDLMRLHVQDSRSSAAWDL